MSKRFLCTNRSLILVAGLGLSALAASAVAEAQPASGAQATSPADSTPPQNQQLTGEGQLYYSEAQAAFLQGDYSNALRLASHAAIEARENARIHELISLEFFALGSYPNAASEAHAAMALGPIADWNQLFAYYNDVDKYTTQLRALEKASSDHPKSGAERFLLAYHYLMTGAKDHAKTELAEAVKLTPNDKLAQHFLDQLNANSPLSPPQLASKRNTESH